MIRSIFLVFVLFILISACTSSHRKENDTVSSDSTSTPSKADTIHQKKDYGYRMLGDSVEIPSFEIEVNLSARAEEKLKNDKETVIVAAYFSGIPKDTLSQEYHKSGTISITKAQRELVNERTAKFKGIKFARNVYDSLATKNIVLLINIYSGRHSTNVNILDCDILEDSISEVKHKKFVINGKLIAE